MAKEFSWAPRTKKKRAGGLDWRRVRAELRDAFRRRVDARRSRSRGSALAGEVERLREWLDRIAHGDEGEARSHARAALRGGFARP